MKRAALLFSIFGAPAENEDFSDGAGNESVAKFEAETASSDDIAFYGTSTPRAASDCRSRRR